MIYELKAKIRKEEGKKVSVLRGNALLPAVIYGPEVKTNIMLTLGYNEFKKVYDSAGENSLINLQIEGEVKPRETLVKDVSYEPVSGRISHIDFYQIKAGQKLDIEVGIKLIGEAPAVKNAGGILFHSLNTLSVRCLAKDMISEIEVDISGLVNIDDRIRVKDMQVPSTLEILNEPNAVVAIITAPEEEKEEAPVKAEMPEVVGADKAAEGEAATAEVKGEEKK